MRRRTLALAPALAVALLVGGCAAEQPADTSAADSSSVAAADGQVPDDVAASLADLGVGSTAVKEVVTELDRVDQARPLAVQASVRPGTVIFTVPSGEVEVPVPGDEVYVSIAPYVDQTHECFYHALGGCQGELVGEDVHVTITDDGGTVLVDEDATTYTNGFVGYWLPEGTTGTIAVTQGDLSGEVPLDTTDEGPTCVTTLQLG